MLIEESIRLQEGGSKGKILNIAAHEEFLGLEKPCLPKQTKYSTILK